MADLPFMPLWVADLMSDRKVHFMTIEQFGVYMIFLCSQWLDGPLPEDIGSLCSLAKNAEPEDVKAVLKAGFSLAVDGWVNEKVERVRQRQTEKHKKLSEAGKRGAKAKKRKDIQGKPGLSQATRVAEATDTDTEEETDSDPKDTYITPSPELANLGFTVIGGPVDAKLSLLLEAYPEKEIRDALSKAQESDKRTMAYVEAILRQRKEEGYPDGTRRKKSGRSDSGRGKADAGPGKFAGVKVHEF